MWVADDESGQAIADSFIMKGALVETFNDPFAVAGRLERIRVSRKKDEFPDVILTDWGFSRTPLKGNAPAISSQAFRTLDEEPSGGKVILDAVRTTTDKRIPVFVITGNENNIPAVGGVDITKILKPEAVPFIINAVAQKLDKAPYHG